MHSIQPDLPPYPGDLWIQIRLEDGWFRDPADLRIDAITTMIESGDVGRWTGQSSGNGYMDIAYAVDNLATSAAAVDQLLQQLVPWSNTLISDHYEARFEALTFGTVACVATLFTNPDGHILFQQRDNTPAIAFPNYWALPGGHVEAGETPAQAIARELWEELELTNPVEAWTDYIFWRSATVLVHQHVFVGTIRHLIEQIPLHEGQALRFLTAADLDQYPIAFGYADVCRWFLASRHA